MTFAHKNAEAFKTDPDLREILTSYDAEPGYLVRARLDHVPASNTRKGDIYRFKKCVHAVLEAFDALNEDGTVKYSLDSAVT